MKGFLMRKEPKSGVYYNQALYLFFGAMIAVFFNSQLKISTITQSILVIYPLGIRYGWTKLYGLVKRFHEEVYTGQIVKKAINKGHCLGFLTGLVEFLFMILILLTVFWPVGLYSAIKHAVSEA